MAVTTGSQAAVTVVSDGSTWTKIATITGASPYDILGITLKATYPSSPATEINFAVVSASAPSPVDADYANPASAVAGQIPNTLSPPNVNYQAEGFTSYQVWARTNSNDSANAYALAVDWSLGQ